MSKPHQLPSGQWRIRWLDTDGKRHSETLATESAATAALRRHQVEEDNIRAGKARPRSNVTLVEAVKGWKETRSKTQREDDESMLRMHITPYLGDYRLGDITKEVLERFKRHLEGKTAARKEQKKKKPLSGKTIKNVLVLTAKLLKDLGFETRIKYKVQASSYDWIRNPAEIGKLLSKCEGWFHTAVAIAVHTGMRLGEIAALRRDALDFDRQLIRVDRSYEGPTKGRKVRWVPMSEALASILRPWLKSHKSELVIGHRLEPGDSLSPMTRRACKRAGIAPVTFHQLRHTAASHLALSGLPIPAIGALLGHESPLTTAKYAHLDTEHVSRSKLAHLNFSAPSGKVLPFPDATGHTVATPSEEKEETEAK